MVFVVVHISVADQETLIDLYHKHSSGQLDNSEAISRSRGLLTNVQVGEAISSLSQYVDLNIEVQEAALMTSATT